MTVISLIFLSLPNISAIQHIINIRLNIIIHKPSICNLITLLIIAKAILIIIIEYLI